MEYDLDVPRRSSSPSDRSDAAACRSSGTSCASSRRQHHPRTMRNEALAVFVATMAMQGATAQAAEAEVPAVAAPAVTRSYLGPSAASPAAPAAPATSSMDDEAGRLASPTPLPEVDEVAPPRRRRRSAMELGASLGVARTFFRDHQLSPRRQGGVTGDFGLALDSLTRRRLDRLDVRYSTGGARAGTDGWRWEAWDLRWIVAPRVLTTRGGDLLVGVDAHLGFDLRQWEGEVSWQALVTAGPALAWRLQRAMRSGLWSLEGVVSSPLVGALGRPGFAGPFQETSLSRRDIFFSAPHNYRGLRGAVSLRWQRPGRSGLRLEFEAGGSQITVRHPASEATIGARVLAYWRF